jgi:hypothetical protein
MPTQRQSDDISGVDLAATPSSIVYTPNPGGFTSFLGAAGCFDFDGLDCSPEPTGDYDAVNLNITTEVNAFTSTPITIATVTPLPAALPLFASGLGFVGYLTRRKKRTQPIAA